MKKNHLLVRVIFLNADHGSAHDIMKNPLFTRVLIIQNIIAIIILAAIKEEGYGKSAGMERSV